MSPILSSLCAAFLLGIPQQSASPLVGSWTLNLERSHYGGGAEPRKQETFTCVANGDALHCTIESVRTDGRKVVGAFDAAYDGKPHPATGIPDVDQVTLVKVDERVADATFFRQGKPVFGYRAIRSDSGSSLALGAVDPVTRAIGSSLIVYDRK